MSCPDCFSGHVHEGTPKGRVTKLHGLDTYIAEPTADGPAGGIIVIIPDAFGWEFVNNRILADHYAEKGNYIVYLPDFMHGSAAPVWGLETSKHFWRMDSIYDWLVKPYYLVQLLYGLLPFIIANAPGRSWPIVQSFFTAIRANEGKTLPVGAAGFCWGGKHTVTLAHGHTTETDKIPLIDAGFTGHPSLLSIPGDLEKVTKPVSVAIGDKDFAVKPPQIEQIRAILEGKTGNACGEVKTYYGVGHGFCVRADYKVEDVARQASEAEDQAIEWFNRHFRNVSY